MTYQTILPQVFPHMLTVEPAMAVRIAEVLTEKRPGIPYGSSFAVTSDVHKHDRRNVWLSDVSYRTLMSNHAVILHRSEIIEDGT